MSEEYYAVLTRAVAAAAQDHAQLRKIVYNLARSELRRQLYQREKFATFEETRQQVSALEAAIEQVETEIGGDTKRLAFSSRGAGTGEELLESEDAGLALLQESRDLTVPRSRAVEVLPPVTAVSRYGGADRWQLPASRAADTPLYPTPPVGKVHRAFWWRLQLLLVVIFGVAIFAVAPTPRDLVNSLKQRVRFFLEQRERVTTVATGDDPRPNSVMRNLGFPVPSAYGVYAVSDGHLTDLHTLPIRIPDPRVTISGLFSQPSGATVPDGRLQFVVFRRDLVNNAPEHAVVRVVAQVMRALTFKAGKATTTEVKGSWAVRHNAYEMRVAPVEGHPEMVTIRPEDPDFLFPAGRYALVIGNVAYDFTVAGPISDPAHCLERTDAMNMPVYNECRNP